MLNDFSGDYAAQALIIAALKHHFPEDEIVAEEEASKLRENSELKELVWSFVKDTKLDNSDAEAKLGGSIKDTSSLLSLIDQGNSKGGASGRIWAIDPIDGTKGKSATLSAATECDLLTFVAQASSVVGNMPCVWLSW